MTPADIAAADYIVSLWGRKRRAFARAYWLHLTRALPCPAHCECYGSERICDRLIDLYQGSRSDRRWEGGQ